MYADDFKMCANDFRIYTDDFAKYADDWVLAIINDDDDTVKIHNEHTNLLSWVYKWEFNINGPLKMSLDSFIYLFIFAQGKI